MFEPSRQFRHGGWGGRTDELFKGARVSYAPRADGGADDPEALYPSQRQQAGGREGGQARPRRPAGTKAFREGTGAAGGREEGLEDSRARGRPHYL